jgi:Phosphomannose isomerase
MKMTLNLEASMKEIIFLEPVFKTMIWGGNKLETDFGLKIPSNQTGECWGISAHKNGDCTIKNGTYQGYTLSWLWSNHRELFGNTDGDGFPLLIKIIDAKADLSIQVHPDNDYASKNEKGASGKAECWYILDCEEDSEIIIGHNARDKQELKEMIYGARWEELITPRPIKKGDIFQIEPGTVHAIKKGTMLLEIQQSSDITYRLYDYGRLENGKPRELHLEKSIDVIRCPHVDAIAGGKKTRNSAYERIVLIECDYYTVEKFEIFGELELKQNKKFQNVSVINGRGTIDGIQIEKGDFFLIPTEYGPYLLSGEMELVISSI